MKVGERKGRWPQRSAIGARFSLRENLSSVFASRKGESDIFRFWGRDALDAVGLRDEGVAAPSSETRDVTAVPRIIG
jgi:hypothetical protein